MHSFERPHEQRRSAREAARGRNPEAFRSHAESAGKAVRRKRRTGTFVELWLPSTAAPSPPVVDRIQSGFNDLPTVRLGNLTEDGTVTFRAERRSSHRIWLRRPWLSSGEDERLGGDLGCDL